MLTKLDIDIVPPAAIVLEIAKPIDRLLSSPKEQKDIHDLRGLSDLGDLPAILKKIMRSRKKRDRT